MLLFDMFRVSQRLDDRRRSNDMWVPPGLANVSAMIEDYNGRHPPAPRQQPGNGRDIVASLCVEQYIQSKPFWSLMAFYSLRYIYHALSGVLSRPKLPLTNIQAVSCFDIAQTSAHSINLAGLVGADVAPELGANVVLVVVRDP